MCHAEGRTTAAILLLAELAERPVHIAHVARKEEVRKKQQKEIIRKQDLSVCLFVGLPACLPQEGRIIFACLPAWKPLLSFPTIFLSPWFLVFLLCLWMQTFSFFY